MNKVKRSRENSLMIAPYTRFLLKLAADRLLPSVQITKDL